MIRIKNTANKPCSFSGCDSINIARKKGWLCSYHLQKEYNEKSNKGIKNWNKGNKKPIRKRSIKGAALDRIYLKKRKVFLALPENKLCPVNKRPTDQIHHKMGRIGFADSWARLNNVPLLIDERFFLAVSDGGHKYIEANTNESYEKKWSVKRIININ